MNYIKHRIFIFFFLIPTISSCFYNNKTEKQDRGQKIKNNEITIQKDKSNQKEKITSFKDLDPIGTQRLSASTAYLNNDQLYNLYPSNSYATFEFDVNSDSIKDKVVTKINNPTTHSYQGDKLYIYLGKNNNTYELKTKTKNFTDEAGWFLYDIKPRPNKLGFIITNYFSDKGNSILSYYLTLKDNKWIIEKYTSEGTSNSNEVYHCVTTTNTPLEIFESNYTTSYYDLEISKNCFNPSDKYKVHVEKAEILNEEFNSYTPPNYYIKNDIVNAIEQNEDWVKVSYKDNTKLGWIDKRQLVPTRE